MGVLRVDGQVLEVEDVEAHEHLVSLMVRGELDIAAVDGRLRQRVR